MKYDELKVMMRKVLKDNNQTILFNKEQYSAFRTNWKHFVNDDVAFAINVKAKCMDVYLKYMPTVPRSQQMKLAKLKGWLTL